MCIYIVNKWLRNVLLKVSSSFWISTLKGLESPSSVKEHMLLLSSSVLLSKTRGYLRLSIAPPASCFHSSLQVYPSCSDHLSCRGHTGPPFLLSYCLLAVMLPLTFHAQVPQSCCPLCTKCSWESCQHDGEGSSGLQLPELLSSSIALASGHCSCSTKCLAQV